MRRTGLAFAAFVAAVVFFALGIVIRVLVGPVSLGPFTGNLRSALEQVLPGLEVRFDRAELEWSSEEGRIDLVVLGARVFDSNQRIIAQAPKAEIDLAAGPFIRGHIKVRRIALVGVQLTLVHTKDGRLRLGVEQDRSQNDVLERIRDALSKNGNGATSLKTFAITHARLAFYEEETGLFIVSPETNLEVTTSQSGERGSEQTVVAALDARVEISGQPAHVVASVNIPRDTSHVTGEVSVTGLNLGALSTNSKFYSFLEPFALVTDISGAFTLDHGQRLTLTDYGIGASGNVNGLGSPLHVKSLKVVGRYDGATGRLLIDDATLDGEQVHAHMQGLGNLDFDNQGILAKASVDLTMDKFGFDMRDVMKGAVTLGRAALRASYVPAQKEIDIDQALVFGGALSAGLKGKIALANGQSPAIQLDGKVNAIAMRDLLRYWPLKVAGGARGWIDRNVTAGQIGPLLIHTNIAAGALDQPALPEDAVAVTFPISDATISYIHGMTPLTHVRGTAELSGDTFKGDIGSASIGPLTMTKSHAVIAGLHVTAAPLDIEAHIDGSVPQVLALIDEKPLQYPTKFHLNSQSSKGLASIDLSVRVPTRHDVQFDDVVLGVKAGLTNLALQIGEHFKITNGNANISVNNASLHAIGTAMLGDTNIAIDWLEMFKAVGPYSTHMVVKGTLDDAARATMNLHTGSFLSGPVVTTAQLDGRHGTVQRAQVSLDLTPATVSLDLINYKKPAGTPAAAQLAVRFGDDGDVRSEDITLSGAGLSGKGTATFGPAGDLEHLEASSLHAGPANDFAFALTTTPATGLDLTITGHSLDGTALGHRDPNANDASSQSGKSEDTNNPFHVAVRVDKLVLRDGVTIAPLDIDVAGEGERPRTMSLNSALSKGVPLTGSIADTAGERHLTIETTDAGQLLKGLFGLSAMKGGKLKLAATMPPMSAAVRNDPNAVEYAGTLTIDDFTIVNQPFLTRAFSSGSFNGFTDLMNGQGIEIEKLQMPFTMHGDVIDVHDARASGPSLGITADGYIDRQSNQLALRGAFAPLYGINSVLGAIPILGQVFVSKKGEGIIGVTYSATGSADEPQVSMNPLSVLAPGILRRIFQGAVPTAPQPQANTAPPPTPTPAQ